MEKTSEVKISPHFWLRRLHSLSGIVPIGAFLVEHMISNTFILKGPEAYNGVIAVLSGLPFVLGVEILFIYLPILYHAFYGFYIMFSGKSNLSSYPHAGNVLYTLQRWTGILTFIYIGYHVYHTRLVNLLYGTEVSYERMVSLMHDPKIFVFYMVGLASVMFHFANGIWGFLISWGITVGPKAQKISGVLSAVIGLALFLMGFSSLIHLVRA